MDKAIKKCKSSGLVLMTIRNTHHLGRIGTYGEQCIDEGLISLHFVNVTDHPPVVAPYVGGALKVLGPAVAMAGAFSQGHDDSLTKLVVDKAANTPFGLKVNPDTDAGKRAGDFLANQARNVWSKVRGF